VLSNSSKVLIDTKGSNNILYLPLDKILQKMHATPTDDSSTADAASSESTSTSSRTSYGVTNNRGGRMTRSEYLTRGGK